MTELSYPFGPGAANGASRAMTENQWAQMFRYVLNTGVMAVNFQDELDDLLVMPGAAPLTVNIKTGAAWIQGHYYQSDSVHTLTIPSNPSASIRADMVVLECKWGLDAGITAQVVTGVAGQVWPTTDPSRAGFPMPPQPIQTYGVKWQLPLAQINTPGSASSGSVYATTDIIDWRTFVNAAGAKSSSFVIACDDSTPSIRANADAVIPYGSVNAEQVINGAIATVAGYGGGTVLLSEGTFDTSDTIHLLSNVNLRGLGNRSLIQYHPESHGTNNNPIILADTISNVQITDLALDGGGATLVDATPVSVAPGYDGIYINNGSLVTVRNCTIQHCRAKGIVLFSNDTTQIASFGHRVDANYVGDCSEVGIYMEGNGGLIQNNQVVHNGIGINLYSATGTGSYGASVNVVSNNSVRQSLYDGLSIDAASGGGNCSQNLVSGNMVSNSSKHANGSFSNISLIGAKCMNNTITGNHCGWDGDAHADIWIDSVAHDCFIFGNYVTVNGISGTGTNNCIVHNFKAYNNC